MKTITLFIVLFLGFIATITAAYKPEIFQKKIELITEPVRKLETMQLQLEKEQKLSAWMKRLETPSKCTNPETELKKLECKNLVDEHRNQFEIAWMRNHVSEN